jgi:hypothetical protein
MLTSLLIIKTTGAAMALVGRFDNAKLAAKIIIFPNLSQEPP